mgnify:CR=1 FL=1
MNKEALMAQMGRNIRTSRKEKGLTQEQLAEAVGITPSFCAQIEAGSRAASVETLYQIAEALEVSASALIYGSTHSERILHITNMLKDMSETNLAYVERYITLTKEWCESASK